MSSPASRTPNVAALTKVVAADVYKKDLLAARLVRVQGTVHFEYDPEYLSQGEPAVATTLPLSDEPVVTARGAVPPYFAGLLPEGRRLSALRRAVKTSADDDLSLLLAVGLDPVGDVQIVPAGQHPTPAEPLVCVDKAFEEVTFFEILEAAGVIDPVALAGVQDKASARMISVPVGQAGERYILKVDPPEFPHVVENEAYFIRRAALAHFPVVDARIVHDANGRPGLLVERFDRVNGPDGQPTALAVEDAAQVMGLYPADKYRISAEATPAPPVPSPPGTSSDNSASRGSPATGMPTRSTSPSWPHPQANGASRPPTTFRPRCRTAITPSRWRCSAGKMAYPAGPCLPSLTPSVFRRVQPSEPWRTCWQQPSRSPMSSRRARCRSPRRSPNRGFGACTTGKETPGKGEGAGYLSAA